MIYIRHKAVARMTSATSMLCELDYLHRTSHTQFNVSQVQKFTTINLIEFLVNEYHCVHFLERYFMIHYPSFFFLITLQPVIKNFFDYLRRQGRRKAIKQEHAKHRGANTKGPPNNNKKLFMSTKNHFWETLNISQIITEC